jgi:hypothetical protein
MILHSCLLTSGPIGALLPTSRVEQSLTGSMDASAGDTDGEIEKEA